jgi:chemotaxis protein CheY-P-specific phosphatase CheC
MELSQQENEALLRMINISLDRAGQAISVLIQAQVAITHSQIHLFPIAQISNIFTPGGKEVSSIHQVFTGSMNGITMVVIEPDSLAALVRYQAEGIDTPIEPHTSNDILEETGNIILSSFTGEFCNLLNLQVKFTVPRVGYQSLSQMFETLMIEQDKLQYLLTVQSEFRLMSENTDRRLLIIMGILSLESLKDVIARNI